MTYTDYTRFHTTGMKSVLVPDSTRAATVLFPESIIQTQKLLLVVSVSYKLIVKRCDDENRNDVTMTREVLWTNIKTETCNMT